MVLPIQYTYFVGTLLFFIPWLILFWWRKDIRKEMLFMSIFMAVVSVVGCGLFCTIDWWRPQTITGTIVGLEDFLLGFSNGGIAAVLYEVIFKRRLYKRKAHHSNLSTIGIVVFGAFILSFLFWTLGITSFVASSIAMIVTASIILYHRKDLFINAFMSGLLMMVVSFPIYWTLYFLTPGWVQATYLFEHLSGVLITGIPIEDLLFYSFFGFLVGPFYEYWQNLRTYEFLS